MPDACAQKRYVVQKSVTACLDFAAVMAQAARLFLGNTEYADYSTDIIGHYMFMYWLRTPGEGADYACFVGPLGNIGEENRSLNQGRITDMQGVRPAMYIEYETE